ncbi:hypothetical protein TWF730_002557 [Orbilia blumenaviensis]|uniref:F-box domain-containing protein n=1 Tax=Orbilia blumenaviensis TaxID=1796055 RepID=A0AAV9UCH8_9PEZI
MQAASLTTLPREVQAHILSFLLITTQITAYQVCALWRSLLITPQLQATRYQLLPRSSRLPSKQQKESIYVHQLLYNEVICSSTCQECIERLQDFDYFTSFPRSESYYPASITPYLQAYLMAILNPDREISSYELRLEVCKSTTGYTFDRTPLAPSHPFLNEPVLSPISRRDMKETDTKDFPSLYYLRSPGLMIQLTVDDDQLKVFPSTTVRKLAAQAWRMTKRAVDNDCEVKSMDCFRLAFPVHCRTKSDGSGLPILKIDLETGELIYPEPEEAEEAEVELLE